ncbi:regulator of telomere elongation helicase 1, partial [Tanacetum coccineum]
MLSSLPGFHCGGTVTDEKSNALLESPTGTGKTLCLLCATLAWRKSLGSASMQLEGPSSRKLPTIVYTSRTHSQIRQVIQELKKTVYRPKMVVLGSREHLCVHPRVSQMHGKRQTTACRFLCQNRAEERCDHYPLVTDYVKSNPDLGAEPIDIEDLVKLGKPDGPCPYHLSRELHKSVDILFAPYNYLIDPGNTKSLSIEWENSVLIFDEAHNLESVCSEAASFDLTYSVLDACNWEAYTCIDLANSAARDSQKYVFLR